MSRSEIVIGAIYSVFACDDHAMATPAPGKSQNLQYPLIVLNLASPFAIFTEASTLNEHNKLLIETISLHLVHFSGEFVEKGFVEDSDWEGIRSMYGVGNQEKADQLMRKVKHSLRLAKNKQKWFQKFVAIFSRMEAYKELADRLMETYSGTYDMDLIRR